MFKIETEQVEEPKLWRQYCYVVLCTMYTCYVTPEFNSWGCSILDRRTTMWKCTHSFFLLVILLGKFLLCSINRNPLVKPLDGRPTQWISFNVIDEKIAFFFFFFHHSNEIKFYIDLLILCFIEKFFKKNGILFWPFYSLKGS